MTVRKNLAPAGLAGGCTSGDCGACVQCYCRGDYRPVVKPEAKHWTTTRRTATGLEVVRLEKCPGCGVRLWGLPAEALHQGEHL
jgi:hypothetical protein